MDPSGVGFAEVFHRWLVDVVQVLALVTAVSAAEEPCEIRREEGGRGKEEGKVRTQPYIRKGQATHSPL